MPLSVGQARERVGESDVWVYGYIVGGSHQDISFVYASVFIGDEHRCSNTLFCGFARIVPVGLFCHQAM